jgi:hypothetical protein
MYGINLHQITAARADKISASVNVLVACHDHTYCSSDCHYFVTCSSVASVCFTLGSPAFTSPDLKSLVYRNYFPVSQRIWNKFGLMDSTYTIAHPSSTNLGVVQEFEPCIDRLDPPCQVYLWIMLHFIDTLVMCVCGGGVVCSSSHGSSQWASGYCKAFTGSWCCKYSLFFW